MANSISRRGFLGALAAGSAALVASRALQADERQEASLSKRPNIILILTDDQGYGDLGRNGNPVIKTPNLDRFYDQSVRFEDFHASPTCAPTRCSIMTGRHEFRSGVTHTIYERERMSLQATTIAQILKSAGYSTGIFGKWHLGDEEPYQPEHRGFDEVFIHGGGGIGQTFPGSCGDAIGNKYFDPAILHNGRFEKTKGYCTDIFFDQAIKWLDTKKSGDPFFCYIATNAPHTPLDVPESYHKMYAGLPELKGDDNAARFLGMVTNIDDNVGKLVSKLKEWDIERDTLVVFINDNGGTAGCKVFNAGMRGAKCTAFNGGTRAMSLWRWPGVLKPGAVNALTAHLDLFPTFAEFAGADIPEEVQSKLEGFSLLPLLRSAKAPWHDDRILFTHVGRWKPGDPPAKYENCSVRWKQYLYFPAEGAGELHDLQQDPGETTDVAARHPSVASKLSEAYDEWWKQTLPCLVNEDAYKTAPEVNPYKALYAKQFGLPDSAIPRAEMK